MFLGYQAGYSETGSNKLYIANSSTSNPLIWGDFSSNLVNINGKLGIGTDDPKEALHVNGYIRGNQDGAVRVSTGNGYVEIGPKNSTWSHFYTDRGRYFFNRGLTVDEGLIGSYDEDLSLQTNGNTALTILKSNRNVGIGTTSPQRTLSVAGYIRSASDASETNYIELWRGGSHGFINKEGIGDLDFRLNGISRLTLADDGLL